ncbi:peptide ligase PGM1-related protein [Bradyrhizobium sp. HKCCYLS2038]|uniref:peptide ligase PGM1-related protein n=1 Tax=unclassified Bradyrhizobium TaxID=2631580 RepID=UPI003EC06C47
MQQAGDAMADLGDMASPGATEAERTRFRQLQAQFAADYDRLFDDPALPRTVLIVPSLTLDPEVLAKVSGVHHYEERMLCMLLLLRLPRTRVIYVTSTAMSETIIDYYLHLLPGIPSGHARARLTMLSCDDASAAPLTQKILQRPRLLARLDAALRQGGPAHLSCFTVTELERRLALVLGLPIYGCDPALASLGSKSGSRRIFKEAGIDLPDGFEDLFDADALADALTELKRRKPELRKAVVKLNEGFSGEGNAIVDLSDAPADSSLRHWLGDRLPLMAFEARGMVWELFAEKLRLMGGIVEAFVPGETKTSPSAQLRIDPLGRVHAVSTHDQLLGGPSGQIFLGCRFPADDAYRREVQSRGVAVAEVLARKGVIGRLGVDFISVRDGASWRHVAIEINLRKGGTTHPFLMLQFLTDGRYDAGSCAFLTPSGEPRCYYASDNLENAAYRGLTPDDLVDIAVLNGLHFHAAAGEGVAFHLIGALSEFGKLGVVCIGRSHERAAALYQRTVAVLDSGD